MKNLEIVCQYRLLPNLLVVLTLEILLWKLPREYSSIDENVVSGNNEMIEICMNDGIMEENVIV
jgi:hypothetical protein